MRKVRVVALRICDAWRGFGRGVEPFVGFGLPFGCGVVLGAEAGRFWVSALVCTLGSSGFGRGGWFTRS